MQEIVFHKSFTTPTHLSEIFSKLDPGHLHGNGPVTDLVKSWLAQHLGFKHSFLTPSCTSALEMAALILDIQPGDEVILPSYTFVTSASAFALRGAKLIYVDVDPDTLCLKSSTVETAISQKTKAIVPIHYGGWCSDLEKLVEIAKDRNIYVVEDAAQALNSKYKGQHLGSFGDLSTFSFHATKNIHCGEGGALIVNNEKLLDRAYMVQEKGTNRRKFLRGEIEFYNWQCLGSSFLISEYSAALLLDQLNFLDNVTAARKRIWNFYHQSLSEINNDDISLFPIVSPEVDHCAHIFYVVFASETKKNSVLKRLSEQGISTLSHYSPLHLSPFGKKVGETNGSLKTTELATKCLIRLPIYPEIEDQKEKIMEIFCNEVHNC